MKEATVSLEEAKEQVSRACRRLGLLHLSYARTLIEELGEKKGKQLILKAIKAYGLRVGEKVKTNVIAQGKENLPANYAEDLPLYGMVSSKEIIEVDGEKRTRLHDCILAKVWNEFGEDKLGRLYCYVDAAKFMAYNPNFKLIHVKALPDGDTCCEITVKPTTEQERKDFSSNDRDWSYLDKM